MRCGCVHSRPAFAVSGHTAARCAQCTAVCGAESRGADRVARCTRAPTRICLLIVPHPHTHRATRKAGPSPRPDASIFWCVSRRAVWSDNVPRGGLGPVLALSLVACCLSSTCTLALSHSRTRPVVFGPLRCCTRTGRVTDGRDGGDGDGDVHAHAHAHARVQEYTGP